MALEVDANTSVDHERYFSRAGCQIELPTRCKLDVNYWLFTIGARSTSMFYEIGPNWQVDDCQPKFEEYNQTEEINY